ncbi:tetratricopeptide repeat protein [bacterium]|nr:tetratricopeptide repeat protein [bacterium]
MLKPQKKLSKRELKQDKLVIAWFKATDYLTHHVREILIGLGALAALIAIIVWYNYDTQQKEQEASVLLAHGKSAYESQLYSAAIDSLVKLVNNHGGTPSAATGTIYLANAFMQKKEFEFAEKYYKAYLDDYGSDPILSAAAAAGIAATFDERGNYAEAAKLYEKTAKDYHSSYRVPELLMHAARCYQLANQAEAAHRVLAQLLEKHPKSKFEEDAKMLQAELRS